MSTDTEIDAYTLLELDQEATEKQIRTAYRQRSLKVHPDRNPNNPDAARKFHELTQAYELLLDPLRRLALDTQIRTKKARAERYKNYDNKRKNMLDELEERERAFKKTKLDKQREEEAVRKETERIKEEGRRMREERESAVKLRERERERDGKEDESAAPTLGPTDTTVHVKFNTTKYPTLNTATALSTLFSSFGETDTSHIVIRLKPPKKDPTKPPKYGSALVPFKKIGDAFAAVCASGKEESGLGGVEVGWVGGTQPRIIGWLVKMGWLGSGAATPSAPSPTAVKTTSSTTMPTAAAYDAGAATNPPASGSPFSSFPDTFPDSPPPPPPKPDHGALSGTGLDYESLTLMRMRQAERERLEREILEREAEEG